MCRVVSFAESLNNMRILFLKSITGGLERELKKGPRKNVTNANSIELKTKCHEQGSEMSPVTW